MNTIPKPLVIVTFLLCLVCSVLQAQDKRALLIAIDKYSPPAGAKASTRGGGSLFRDLDGCLNDARSMHTIIRNKFDFPESNIDSLYNAAATRQGILDMLDEFLAKCKPNDVAFIYYAGHGSQVTNTASKNENDKKDESMVPSDTWKEGVKDIRDKELAAIYNKFLDNGIKLTVIMDCCHSGSLSRGPGDPGQFRYIPDPNYNVNDPSQPNPPEDRPEGNFLIMSAAQDNEFAQEQRDENNMPHGAFTLAFIQALNQQSVDASVLNLFTSVRAILKSNGRKQEPVLGGTMDRQFQTLFGLSKGSVPDKARVAISGINGDKITLQGGFAIGLYKENELAKLSGTDTIVKLRVDTVMGVNRSIATVIKGDPKALKAGEFLDVTNWVSSGAPALRVYIPNGLSSIDLFNKQVELNKALKQSSQVKWVNDLQSYEPYASVFMIGDKYYVNADDGKGLRELKDLTVKSIVDLGKDSTVYFEMAPTRELSESIKKRLSMNRNIMLVNSPDEANYVLFGTISQDGKPSFGLRRSQVSSKDSSEVMPVQTANFILDGPKAQEKVADSLFEYAMRLFKVRGWLQLTGPQKEKANFPYTLVLMDDNAHKPVIAEGARIGDAVSLHIVADPVVNNPNFNPATISQKYVYVFAINKLGKMTLLYPGVTEGNGPNKFPQREPDGSIKKDLVLAELEVEEPVGVDHLFLLATDEPIATYAILFEQDGVRGIQMRDKGESNPLGDILNIGNEKTATRNYRPKTPSNWVLYKLQVRTRK